MYVIMLTHTSTMSLSMHYTGATAYQNLYDSNGDIYTRVTDFNCSGSEPMLVNCSFTPRGYYGYYISHNNYAGIKCCECINFHVMSYSERLTDGIAYYCILSPH